MLVFMSASPRVYVVLDLSLGTHFAFDSIAVKPTLFFLDDWGRQTTGGLLRSLHPGNNVGGL